MNAKTLIAAVVLGSTLVAPAVYAADQNAGQSLSRKEQSKQANTVQARDAQFLNESNQPGGVGG
ncbi:MAG TPA: hypothetical protein VN667_11810 [Burkholderiales bacterium]|nr:hypothetical protein [Burkholderiales bacterium]